MTRLIVLFLIGAFGYGSLELIWRGFTHWTMFVLGGICFSLLFFAFEKLNGKALLTKAIIGGVIITSAEFITGLIVNILLKWDVWDYTSSPFNILGQICLPYTLLWILLSVPLVYLCRFLTKYI